MKRSNWQKLGLVTGFALLIVGIIAIAHHHDGPTNYPKCSFNAPPCIRIHEQNGQTYGLNDFRFLKNNCVWFVSLPDHVQRSACQPYTLEWIGTSGA